MMMRTIVVCASLIAISFLCLANCNEKDVSLSRAQIDALSKEILKNTPENVHFTKGTTFSWVLLRFSPEDRFPKIKREILSRMQGKYVVYESEKEIPIDSQRLGEDGKLLGYQDGFSFSIVLKPIDENRVEIRYRDWEGVLAASGRTIVYLWDGETWQVNKKRNGWIS